jgi:hypothetical protein
MIPPLAWAERSIDWRQDVSKNAKPRGLFTIAILLAAGLAFGAALGLGRSLSQSSATPQSDDDDYQLLGAEGGDARFPVIVNRPDGPPRVDTGILDGLGRPVTVSCASCHANMEPNFTTRSSAQLEEFHLGLHFDHGNMTCLTCHNANNYNALRLADGTEIAYANVQSMCAQCHAPQARDFDRGAHGGMTGYWDRSRGPQVRKNCIDCHDPHAPAFPHMIPTFKPIDRFLDPPHDGH